MHLEERVVRQRLSEHAERLEHVVAVAEAAIRISRRERDFRTGGGDRAGPCVRDERSPKRQRDVAEPAGPAILLPDGVDRDDGLHLVPRTEPPLVHDLVADRGSVAARDVLFV